MLRETIMAFAMCNCSASIVFAGYNVTRGVEYLCMINCLNLLNISHFRLVLTFFLDIA